MLVKPCKKSLSCETKIKVPLKLRNASFKTFLDAMSKWFVGSSIINTLKGDNNNLHNANLFLSPPESTFAFLSAASPPNKNEPSISLTLALFPSVAASSMICNTVFSGGKCSD